MLLNSRTNLFILKRILKSNVNISPIITGSNVRLITTKSMNTMSVIKLAILGVAGGTLIGTGYSLYKMNEPRGHIINESIALPLLSYVPRIEPSRRVVYPNDTYGLELTLYQYQTCPFCCKVRAFLDYQRISYNVVEVDPVLRQSIRWSSYKKVPIVIAKVDKGYQQLNDSSMIISALSSYTNDTSQTLSEIINYYPNITFLDDDGVKKSEIMNRYFLMFHGAIPKNRTNEDIIEERKWREWADKKLVHSLSPNVYRTLDEALQAFQWFSDAGEWDKHFPMWERILIIYVGAFAMWLISKRLKAKHNLKNDVRLSLYDDCDYWMRTLNKKGTPFLGGNEPNLADLAVFGILSSIEGCTAFQDVLRNTKLSKWYFKMKKLVQHEIN